MLNTTVMYNCNLSGQWTRNDNDEVIGKPYYQKKNQPVTQKKLTLHNSSRKLKVQRVCVAREHFEILKGNTCLHLGRKSFGALLFNKRPMNCSI